MKSITITFQTFLDALKHQWKVILVSLLLFFVLGLCAGYLYAGKTSAPAEGGAEALELVDFSPLLVDDAYYSSCYKLLSASHENLMGYLKKLAAEPTLTKDQAELIQTRRDAAEQFRLEVLRPLQSRLEAPGTILVPVKLLDQLTTKYETRLESIRLDLIAAETVADIVKQMDSPDVASEESASAYGKLLSQAAQYGSLKKEEAFYTAMLAKLQEQPEAVIADSRELKGQLDAAARQLNALTEDCCETADVIASENYLRISVQYMEGESPAEILIVHTHAASTPQESFLIMTLFCVLTGICVGVFLAVCRESGVCPRFAGKRKKASKGKPD